MNRPPGLAGRKWSTCTAKATKLNRSASEGLRRCARRAWVWRARSRSMSWRSSRVTCCKEGGAAGVILRRGVSAGFSGAEAAAGGGSTGSEASRRVVPLRRHSRACANKVDRTPTGPPAAGFWCFSSVRSLMSESGRAILCGARTGRGAGSLPDAGGTTAALVAPSHCKLIVIFCP